MTKHPFSLLMSFIFLVFLASCGLIDTENDKSKEQNNNRYNGVVKNYRKDGSLLSTITYKDSLKNGPARNYYKSGNVQAEIMYKDGLKHGKEKVFFKDGGLYQVTTYKNGVIDGSEKKYHRNGKLAVEIPYSSNTVMPGLKEYSKSGKLLTRDPDIIFTLIDKIAFEDKFILKMQLSDESKVAVFSRYYLDNHGNYIGKSLIESKNGIGTIEFHLNPGSSRMEKIKVWAERKTSRGNPQVIEGEYNLAIRNKKRFR